MQEIEGMRGGVFAQSSAAAAGETSHTLQNPQPLSCATTYIFIQSSIAGPRGSRPKGVGGVVGVVVGFRRQAPSRTVTKVHNQLSSTSYSLLTRALVEFHVLLTIFMGGGRPSVAAAAAAATDEV